MPDSLYEQDYFRWAEQQSELLRRLCGGERVNAAIDWPNVIEEISDVGQSGLHGCESFLAQAILHLLKVKAWPEGPERHWIAEALRFMADAERRFSPSMRQHIDLEKLYRKALRQVSILRIDGRPPRALPQACPWSLDELLAGEPDVVQLIEAG